MVELDSESKGFAAHAVASQLNIVTFKYTKIY